MAFEGLPRGSLFFTEDFSGDYNINNDADLFHLYLDGKEIDFY